MKIEDSVVLVTGANRGIGEALVAALLAAGARTVYATARRRETLDRVVAAHPGRVVALALDVTSARDVAALAQEVPEVDVVINNAGSLGSYKLTELAPADLQLDLATNVLGPIAVTRALLPALLRSGRGALVNVLSIASLAGMPGLGGYAASKAAAWSATQALRAELLPRGVHVHAVFPGPTDTEMTKGMELPKTSAAEVARAIVAGLIAGEEDIAPDPFGRQVLELWRRDPKALERQFAAM